MFSSKGGNMNTKAERIEAGGYTLLAVEREDGSWIGEIVDRAVPRLTADSRANLEKQFRSMIGSLSENESQLEGQPLDTREDAILHRLHAYSPRHLAQPDADFRPPEPGEKISRERWED